MNHNVKNIPVLWKKKENCCGCTACYAICPNSAIDMIEDKNGFIYPRIDVNKCIKCRMCIKVCPIKNSGYLQSTQKS